jgi:hypothetical protein
MSMQLFEDAGNHVMEVKVTGKLTGRDYDRFAPEMEHFIRQHGKIRMLFDMHAFHGWSVRSMWMDFQFGAKHRHDMERLALVGEEPWQNWSSKFCRLFTEAEVRYFDRSHADEAKAWVKGS